MEPIQAQKIGFIAPAAQPPAMRARATQPQFGNLGARVKMAVTDSGQNVFEKIVEVFLWTFLAQDAIGMWLPRVGVSLNRGRIPYDPQQDPQAKTLPMQDQMRKWFTENLKGLNWVNFIEEAGREFATGPGVLMIPTLMYSIARRMPGKNAVELGHGPLKALSTGFKEHLAALPETHVLNKAASASIQSGAYQQAFKDELAKYLYGTLTSRELQTAKLSGEALAKLAEIRGTALTNAPKNVDQFATDWVRRWVDVAMNQGADGTLSRAEKKTFARLQREQLHALEKEFRHILVDTYAQDIKLGRELAKAGKTTLMSSNHVDTKLGRLASGEYLELIAKWKDYAQQVLKEKAEGNPARLTDIAEGVYKKLVAKKGFLALTATALGGVYLIKLAQWVQSHDAYPGERLNNGSHAAPVAPAGAATAPQPQAPQHLGGLA